VDVALLPEAGSSLLMPARIGHARAFSMFALGEVISGQVAADWGIANAALPASDVSARARAAAVALAGKSPKSVLLTKHLLHNSALILRTIEAECALLPDRVTSPEAQAIYRSFLTRK
jgi:enoyl-CoA hydratase/carnithine racemase